MASTVHLAERGVVTKDEIAEAKAAETVAHAAYIAAKERREMLTQQRLSEMHGVKVGDRVVDKRGRVGIVTRLSTWQDDGKPWVFAKHIKKDGTEGERELNMYSDWTLVEQQPV